MAHFSLARLGKPSGVGVRPGIPGTRRHLTPRGLAASYGVGTIVSNDLLSVRVHTPVTRCSLRLLTTAGKPGGGDPISTTASLQSPDIQRAASTSTTA